MKKFIPALSIVVSCLGIQAQQFNKVEINPFQGKEQFIWSDSSKHIYGGGEFASFVEMNGLLYFVGQDSFRNDELWVTDGTQQGTRILKEINPDGGANISKLYKVGNRILFIAIDSGDVWFNTVKFDLYATDGTTQGTQKIAALGESFNDFLSTNRVVTIGNKFIFCTSTQVMVTDGTAGGTIPISPLAQYGQGFGYCEMNGIVYFLINQNGTLQIWGTDGTANGTRIMKDITSDIMYADNMKAYNGKLYISGAPQGQGSNLFTFDGLPNGTLNRVDVVAGGSCYPTQLNVFNNRLWFVASNNRNTNLYVVNPDHTFYPVPTADTINVYGELSFGNGKVYFGDGMTSKIFHVTADQNFTYGEIDLGSKRMPFYWNDGRSFLIAQNGREYFVVYDSTMQQQYFVRAKNNTLQTFMPAGSSITHPFNALVSCGMADMFDFTVYKNSIVVPANFDESGRELWFFNDADVTADVREIDNSNIKVFPNPSNNVVTIETEGNNYCQTEAEIVDITGRTVSNISAKGNRLHFQVSILPFGEYFAVIKEDGVKKGVVRFTVTK